MTPFEALGKEAALRPIIEDFVDAMFQDTMIGFFFWNVDKPRLKQRELELSAKFLGGKVHYSGRPLPEAHQKHPIMGGHFDRRRQLLKEALDRHHVAPWIQDIWLEHTDRLRAQITKDNPGQCTPQTDPTS